MKINVYSIQRNEAKILPFWIDHYKAIADRIVVYDDQSDDGSRDLLKSSGVEVRDYPGSLLDDGAMASLYTDIYSEDQSADWAILVDADEFLYGWIVRKQLDVYMQSRIDILEVMGYEMWHDSFPNDVFDVRTGEPATWWHNGGYKPCVVSPKADVGFGCGRHYCGSLKTVPTKAHQLKLLHYRNLGYPYYLWHHQRNAARLHPDRADKTWGQHNFKPLTEEQFNEGVKRARVII